MANKALVGADQEARRKVKVTLDDNGERILALLESDMLAKWIEGSPKMFLTKTAVASAAAAVTVVVGPPFPPVVTPSGFSLANPSRPNDSLQSLAGPGAATAAPTRRLAARASVNFMFPKICQALIRK